MTRLPICEYTFFQSLRSFRRSVIEPYAEIFTEECAENFGYASNGDYRLFSIFEDHVRLPVYEPKQWHLHYRERFAIIPSRLSTLEHYAVILERLRMLYVWVDSLPEHDGQESA